MTLWKKRRLKQEPLADLLVPLASRFNDSLEEEKTETLVLDLALFWSLCFNDSLEEEKTETER